jgi:4-diphosphocytidyl-2-C-methyl-D-erythritol kinase
LHDDIALERLAEGRGARAGGLDIRWADDAPGGARPVEWPLEHDLAQRARALLEAEAGRPLPCVIRIRKRIAAGAGLGGGSSDAASVLRLLDVAFDLGLGAGRLRRLSARLGSDVAFFLDESLTGPPRPALVTGFGDELERAAAPGAGLALIVPDFGCATPAVYRAFDTLEPGPLRLGEVAAMARDPSRLDPRGESLFNDLAAAAELLEPRLAALRERIGQAAGCAAHVTGSGSAMFVISDEPEALAARLRPAVPSGSVIATRIMTEAAAP